MQIEADRSWTTASAGVSHNLALKTDGSLWAWGLNSSGQLGTGTSATAYSPVRVGTLSGWVKISAGDSYSLAIRSDGSLWAWGLNYLGQLGTGGGSANAPVRVGTGNDWLSVSAGSSHSLALKADGSLWAWGANSSGQLGLGDVVDRSAPMRVGTGNDWVSISAGLANSAAVRSNGEVWLWGNNEDGQLGTRGGNRLAPAVASLAPSPDIRVTTPSGTKSETFPVTPAGQPVSKNFTIYNFGSAPLVISAITTPSGFTTLPQAPLSLTPGQSQVVPTTFAASQAGTFSGDWSAASNDPDEPVSTIGLTARALSYVTDGDGDGFSDAAEFRLGTFGFHWDSPDPMLVNLLRTEGHRAGLMSEPELRALRPASAFFKTNDMTGRAPIRLRLEKATSALNFATIGVTGANVDGTGRLLVPQPRGPESAAFFRFSLESQP